ncbi:unnamed protein product, partial [marine sediment metagenome]
DDRITGLVHLGVGHGYRCEELCRSNVGDIGDDGRIYVRGKKGREFFPLLPETREVLLRVAGGRKADEPLFLSQMGRRLSDRQCYNIIKELFRATGVLDGKPKDYRIATHALRKTFSSLALDAGCDSKIVDRLLRHRTRTTADLYLSIPFELLRRNLEHYSPLRLVNQTQNKLPKTEYFQQLEPKGAYPEDDPARLIPELLDRLAALGDLAKQVSYALGNNGHRADQVRDLTKQLQRRD